MLDQYKREIDYMRLSITERCNMKCIYCRSENCGSNDEMSITDISRVMKQIVSLGIKKIRITGGEPLVRHDLEDIIREISKNPGVKELSMTTNGQGLKHRISDLQKAGLKSVNISIDSLKPENYFRITRGGNLASALEGIHAAIGCGLDHVKLNTVLLKGINDDEIDAIIELARQYPIDVRFIELMPIGILGQDRDYYLSNFQVLKERTYLKRISPRYASQPSEDYSAKGFKGRVGFISPISHKFCTLCNRIRITSDGKLKTCLGVNSEVDLNEALQKNDTYLRNFLEKEIYNKPDRHCFEKEYHSIRNMSRIGG